MIKAAPTVSTNLNSPFPPHLVPTLLFEDPHLVVLSKPSGLLSQGEHSGDFNLVDWLRGYFNRHYVGLIHRLDRNTSGIMIVAKRTKAANRLTQALQTGKLTRTYLGWVVGTLTQPVRWVHHLEKNSETNLVRVIRNPRNQNTGKESALSATPKEHFHWKQWPLTLVEFKLETGRSHQIRVQAAHEGFPLLGDRKYGPRVPNQPLFPRTALHSFRLEFPHPMSGEVLRFEDPLPQDLKIQPLR